LEIKRSLAPPPKLNRKFDSSIAMKALIFHAPGKVSVDAVPDPTIQKPDDVILRVTSTAICGWHLHI
jgi:D-arabinose 1-dehydrogenase-like Zn-dependent alcohol dehydrogenase